MHFTFLILEPLLSLLYNKYLARSCYTNMLQLKNKQIQFSVLCVLLNYFYIEYLLLTGTEYLFNVIEC